MKTLKSEINKFKKQMTFESSQQSAKDLQTANENSGQEEDKLTDEQLFLMAMQGVEPIKSSENIIQSNREQSIQNAKQKLRKIRAAKVEPLPDFDAVIPESTQPIGAFDKVSMIDSGVRIQDRNRLKNSQFRVEAVLDLHGKTAQEAEIAIDDFIRQALAYNLKFVRIIHGKGYNSNNEFPVLKNLCYRKLKSIGNIVGFCSAPEKDGGVGALNIQLKTTQ